MVWILFFISIIIVDLAIIVSGYLMEHHVPKDRFGSMGYRTKRSRDSEEAWQYANKLAGRIYFIYGIIISAISIISMIMIKPKSDSVIFGAGMGILIGICVIIIFPVFFIEKKLKEKFDK